MHICKVCNNIKISQIDCSNKIGISQIQYNILFLPIFDVELHVRNERKRVSKMWDNAYLNIDNLKASRVIKLTLSGICHLKKWSFWR